MRTNMESVDVDRRLLREAIESLGDEELKVVTEPILSQLKATITAASKGPSSSSFRPDQQDVYGTKHYLPKNLKDDMRAWSKKIFLK